MKSILKILVTLISISIITNCNSDDNYVNNTNIMLPPKAPKDLIVKNNDSGKVQLIWKDISADEDGYIIERKDENSIYKEIGRVKKNMTSYTDFNTISGQKYYYRVFSFNKAGNSKLYSNEVSITPTTLPTIETTEIIKLYSNSIRVNINTINDGGSSFIKGIVYSEKPNPNYYNNENITTNDDVIYLQNLKFETKYYIKAYIKNNKGVSYGKELTFTTSSAIELLNVEKISHNSAEVKIKVLYNEKKSSYSIGVVFNDTSNPTISDKMIETKESLGNGVYLFELNGLYPETKYFIKAYAKKYEEIIYSKESFFETKKELSKYYGKNITNYSNYVPQDGLVAWWSFSGNTDDFSNNNNDLKSYGATLTEDRAGNPNSAYYFDGIDDYIEGVIKKLPLSNSNRTISGWFKCKVFDNKSWVCILNYGELSDKKRFALGFYGKGYLLTMNGYDFTNENDFYVANKDYNYNSHERGYLQNRWFFFTLTYDGSSTKIYVDGKLAGSRSEGLILNTISSDNIFRIGGRLKGDNIDEFIKGTLDDIGVWNRVLTDNEIIKLYESN